jgi:hypothetical protein
LSSHATASVSFTAPTGAEIVAIDVAARTPQLGCQARAPELLLFFFPAQIADMLSGAGVQASVNNGDGQLVLAGGRGVFE